MKDNRRFYLVIGMIIGAFVAFNIFSKGISEEEFRKAGVEILTENNYQTLMHDTDKPVMVLFNSKTCNVCKIFSPRFLDFANKYKDMARYLVADPDNVNFNHFGIRAYPTTRIYFRGKILEELVGNGSLSPFKDRLESIK